MASRSSETSPVLNFISINGSQPRSLLLVHGAFSSHHEWSLVSKHLPNYHLLIPDLQGHGRGHSASNPLSLLGTASLLADLIAKHAHVGTADIVGFSFGGYAVLLLAARYPELVRSILASGCHLSWQGRWKNWFMGLGLGLNIGLVRTVPKSWFRWLCSQTGMSVSDELYEDMCSSSFVRNGSRRARMEVAHALGDFDMKIWETVGARTLLVVGGNEPYVDEAGKRGELLRVSNAESKAARVARINHAWNLQEPKLFAQGIAAWVEGDDLPEEFVLLPYGK